MQKLPKINYNITQINKQEHTITIPTQNSQFSVNIKLHLEHLVNKLGLVVRRTDYADEYLQFYNYTNYVANHQTSQPINPFTALNNNTSINPFSNQGTNQDNFLNSDSLSCYKHSNLVNKINFVKNPRHQLDAQNSSYSSTFYQAKKIPGKGIFIYQQMKYLTSHHRDNQLVH